MLGDLYTRRGENGQPAKIALYARSCYGAFPVILIAATSGRKSPKIHCDSAKIASDRLVSVSTSANIACDRWQSISPRRTYKIACVSLA